MNEYLLNIKGQSRTYKVRGVGPREAFEAVQGKVYPYAVDLLPTKSGSPDVRMELVGGSRASVSYYKVTKRVGTTIKKKETTPSNKVPVAGKGVFEIMICTDPNYPGVDVEFQPKNVKDSDGTLPRIVFEYPAKGQLILHVWANKNSEEPTHTILFK